jgi:hypothetical protein
VKTDKALLSVLSFSAKRLNIFFVLEKCKMV